MSNSDDSFELSTSSESETSQNNGNDILSTLPQLSDELEYCGLQPLPEIKSAGGKDVDLLMNSEITSLVRAMMDTIWKLIHIHQSTLRRHSEAEDSRHRLADDNKNLRSQVDKLKKDLVNKERQLLAASELEEQLKSEINKLHSDLKKDKEEVRLLKCHASYRDTQHTHEIMKKEKEVSHVQEQLRNSLGLTRSVIRQGLTYKNECNKIPGSEVGDGDSAVKHKEQFKKYEEQEELYRKVIYKFEMNNQALIQENINVRDLYCRLHRSVGLLAQRFAELMDKYSKSDVNGLNSGDKMDFKILSPRQFQMPSDGIQEYSKELHEQSDKYLSTLEAMLEKLAMLMEASS